jgi:hypothetical protein
MGVLRLGRIVHAAITRPVRPPPVDRDGRADYERRRERLVRRLDRLAELRAQANVQGRKPWRDGGEQSWSG